MFYVDNGPCYQARQFKLLTGRLGIHLVYATEFCPEGKGKIERWIQTVQQDFFQEAELSGATTLAELNVFFWAWLDKIYHARKHTSTGHSPRELWEGSSQKIRYVPPEKLVDIFLWEEERTVDKSGTFQLDGNRYPVAEQLVREKIQVRFDPFDLEKVRVYHNGVFVEVVSPERLNSRPTARPCRVATTRPLPWRVPKRSGDSSHLITKSGSRRRWLVYPETLVKAFWLSAVFMSYSRPLLPATSLGFSRRIWLSSSFRSTPRSP